MVRHQNVIEDELGKDPWMIFKQFDENPIAAASIGQVHKAQLPSGEWVAVKSSIRASAN